MDVRLVYFDGCPNWRIAGEQLRAALDGTGHTNSRISWMRVETEEEAIATGFAGSPTILVDGTDLFPGTGTWTGGLACRLYETPAGLAGAPTADAIMSALSERAC